VSPAALIDHPLEPSKGVTAMPQFEFREVPHQDTAVVHAKVPRDGIAEAMARALPAAFAAVGRAGGQPVGAPFAKYLAFGDDGVEFEAGIPVATPFARDGDVQPGEIGGGTAAFAVHAGSYETLGETYATLRTWIEGQGRTPSTTMWESYVTDPGDMADPSALRTEIYWPVE
jgi:effector-binding domain-containing protein